MDLSVSNEKLEEQLKKLRLQNYALKRSVRACRSGEAHNSTDESYIEELDRQIESIQKSTAPSDRLSTPRTGVEDDPHIEGV